MGTSSFMLYIIFLIMVQYMIMFNSCASIFHILTCPKFYISSMSFLTDYMIESIIMYFCSSLINYYNFYDNLLIVFLMILNIV